MKPILHSPDPGSRLIRYAGDRLHFVLAHPNPGEAHWRAFLRTNLTRASRVRSEVVALAGSQQSEGITFAGTSWRDIPLAPTGTGWSLDLPLTETGYFRAKAYCVDPAGRQHWPDGEDVGVSVHPDHLRTGNTIYCAFPRMFGPSRTLRRAETPCLEADARALEALDYAVVPPSGKLRDLTKAVPHIVETLGCRVLHLLPVTPTPTVYAKMGRFGSPYAGEDLTMIDPALVTFDQRTTAVDQFRELTYAMHLRGGLLFLDIVVNHTGWGSRLMQEHPEWFKRDPDGTFHSPGAWGVTWGDLVELDNRCPELWKILADALLTWCRRGVDGFRCDAGYMIPVAVWQYLIARVRHEFPDTVFLLEGLGGPWEATEALLTEGGMQWAYSELFQNHDPLQVQGYLDHVNHQATRIGPLVHYSETHDNDRLAKKGHAWSLLRNRLCALGSHSGAFGFTCGVEWLADEKVDVHESRGLAWGSEPNLIRELATLNRLLRDHPVFFDGAQVARVSPDGSPVLAFSRISEEGLDTCLVLVNLDLESAKEIALPESLCVALGELSVDLLGQPAPRVRTVENQRVITLEPAASFCLSASPNVRGLAGEAYRTLRAQVAWAYRHINQVIPVEELGPAPWRELGAMAGEDPSAFLAALRNMDARAANQNLLAALRDAMARNVFPQVVHWRREDLARIVPVPHAHWLLVQDADPFALTFRREDHPDLNLRSIPTKLGHIVAIYPGHLSTADDASEDAELILDCFSAHGIQGHGRLRLLAPAPIHKAKTQKGLALLINGRGAMARLHADLGAITSKYDCLLGANLHPTSPCDRHVLAKRLRAWVNADGFITPLDGKNLISFEPGPPAQWRFLVHAGDGRAVELDLSIAFIQDSNTVSARFHRHKGRPFLGDPLPHNKRLSLTLRLDLEDRSFHEQTIASPNLGHWFQTNTSTFEDQFLFQPAPDRRLRAWVERGTYHPEPEWSLNIAHEVERGRGMMDHGDAWSPGWFEVPLAAGDSTRLIVSAEEQLPEISEASLPDLPRKISLDSFGERLLAACRDFLAKRGDGLTVIAGYPWFLDWGRDTLIACRGLLAGGFHEEVRRILLTFASLEDRGTLPNMLSAESTANRDTSDAPLWFGLACEEAVATLGAAFLQDKAGTRSIQEILCSIATHHLDGTANGVRVDAVSGLVWSPAHFTWMDTNHPACTPREGYPIELQALWLRLLKHLAKLGAPCPRDSWASWASKVEASLDLFWNEDAGWFHDHLAAPGCTPAARATPDGHLRPNQLFLASLGIVKGTRARRMVDAASRHLLVPGALRSLAPLPVSSPLPAWGQDGRLLNDPLRPYWGRYEGDEDTRRKPAYHNGTAWVWLLPTYCEALAAAWDDASAALAAARAILGSTDRLLREGCVGHLPEILDGDAPHEQRGCDAQAWSATETLRVWIRLAALSKGGTP